MLLIEFTSLFRSDSYRHSGGSRNPGFLISGSPLNFWAPAFFGVTMERIKLSLFQQVVREHRPWTTE